jgi:hypothetical protein
MRVTTFCLQESSRLQIRLIARRCFTLETSGSSVGSASSLLSREDACLARTEPLISQRKRAIAWLSGGEDAIFVTALLLMLP